MISIEDAPGIFDRPNVLRMSHVVLRQDDRPAEPGKQSRETRRGEAWTRSSV